MADTARIAEGLALVRSGGGFAAHELFEELWRAAGAGRARSLPGPRARRGRDLPG